MLAASTTYGADGLLATFDRAGGLECALRLGSSDAASGTSGYFSMDRVEVRSEHLLDVVGHFDGTALFGEGTAQEVEATATIPNGFWMTLELQP